MSRIDRLKEYAKPLRAANWQGAGRDQANIDRWSRRATANSDGDQHRASKGPMKLPNTGKRIETRDTSMKPREARNADKRMVAKKDTNFVGDSNYLRSVRRDA